MKTLLRQLLVPASRAKITLVTDKKLREFLTKKTGLPFVIKRIETNYFAGFGSRVLVTPTIYMTKKVFEDFSWDEKEWIFLHEGGHCKLWHSYYIIFFQIVSGIFGLFLFARIFDQQFFFILPSIFFAGLISFQLSKYVEYAADNFAVKNMDHPQGMISANQKMKQASKSPIYNHSLLRTLFTPLPLPATLVFAVLVKSAEELAFPVSISWAPVP
jgi:Zn-dependent protease with chaperone function